MFPGQNDSSNVLTSAEIGKLKGRDMMVANACKSAGLPMRLQPYLLHDDSRGCGGDWPLAKFPEEEDIECMCRMSDRSIKLHFRTQDPKQVEEDADM